MGGKKNVLVTGGAGYIGSHTCKLLHQRGYVPITLDNLSTGHQQNVKWGPFVEGDIHNVALVKEILQSFKITSVVHFAASAYVGESITNPQKYFHNNVIGTLKLLEAMLACEIKQIVFSSSCATFGIPDTLPISEETRQLPINPYGESKLFVEKTLKWYEKAYGLKWVSLRYFNAAGADSDTELGENHNPETHLIPRGIAVALGHLPNLEIFGTDYPTLDGTAIRDYIHVSDLAAAHVLALRYLHNTGSSQAFNLGIGQGYSVKEVIKTIEDVAGRPCPIKLQPRREGDPPILVAGSEKAVSILGWTQHYGSLRQIVKSAWDWHLKNPQTMSQGS